MSVCLDCNKSLSGRISSLPTRSKSTRVRLPKLSWWALRLLVEQASSLHPSLEFSRLRPNKRVVDGQLVEE
ncbi:hypothetical protein ACSQ67_025013 [Phaseolus vulgaris]